MKKPSTFNSRARVQYWAGTKAASAGNHTMGCVDIDVWVAISAAILAMLVGIVPMDRF